MIRLLSTIIVIQIGLLIFVVDMYEDTIATLEYCNNLKDCK